MGLLARCNAIVCLCPPVVRLLFYFVVANIIGDFLAFPFVHSAWNYIGFEGWFLDRE